MAAQGEALHARGDALLVGRPPASCRGAFCALQLRRCQVGFATLRGLCDLWSYQVVLPAICTYDLISAEAEVEYTRALQVSGRQTDGWASIRMLAADLTAVVCAHGQSQGLCFEHAAAEMPVLWWLSTCSG